MNEIVVRYNPCNEQTETGYWHNDYLVDHGRGGQSCFKIQRKIAKLDLKVTLLKRPVNTRLHAFVLYGLKNLNKRGSFWHFSSSYVFNKIVGGVPILFCLAVFMYLQGFLKSRRRWHLDGRRCHFNSSTDHFIRDTYMDCPSRQNWNHLDPQCIQGGRRSLGLTISLRNCVPCCYLHPFEKKSWESEIFTKE